MKIDVVYASETQQRIYHLNLPEGSTVAQAIELSEVLTDFPEIDLAKNTLGIFSKKITLTTTLTKLMPGDRVEIYRPLLVDPMQKRRILAEKQRKK